MDWSDDERWNEVLEDDYFIDAQMMAHSRQEALDLVGDDRFYHGPDYADFDSDSDIEEESNDESEFEKKTFDFDEEEDEEDDDEEEDDGLYRDILGDVLYVGYGFVTKEEAEMLLDNGIDPEDLQYMDEDEIIKTIEDEDLDIRDFNFL